MPLLYLALLFSYWLGAQKLDTLMLGSTQLLYYQVQQASPEKNGLIIFLHGGVSQHKELEVPVAPSLENLQEHNPYFIPVAHSRGYDLIFPIAFNEYNWLEDGGMEFIKALVKKYAEEHSSVILSGFSDGGTGAYKIFYTKPELFDGVMIFNGFPQHKDFQKTVDYFQVTDKPVIFASTTKDKRIPYEFLLVEYRRQRMLNPNAHFSLVEGYHNFTSYSTSDFNKYLAVLFTESSLPPKEEDSLLISAPVDGWMEGNLLKEVYPFRKKYGRQYGMSAEDTERTDYSFKEFKKLLKKGYSVKISPLRISSKALKEQDSFSFPLEVNREVKRISFNNWLRINTWD